MHRRRNKTHVLRSLRNLRSYFEKRTWKQTSYAEMQKISGLGPNDISNLIALGIMTNRRDDAKGNASRMYSWIGKVPDYNMVDAVLTTRPRVRLPKAKEVTQAGKNNLVVQQIINEIQPVVKLDDDQDNWTILLGFKSDKTHLTITIDKRVKDKRMDLLIDFLENF